MVTFSFRSVPLERKQNARSIGRKRYVPFPKTVIELWAVPLERNYVACGVCVQLLNCCLAVKVQRLQYKTEMPQSVSPTDYQIETETILISRQRQDLEIEKAQKYQIYRLSDLDREKTF